VVVATQNPIEQEGTYPLPEAQLDRFMFSLWMDYPNVNEEEEIVMATTHGVEPAVEQVYSREQMIEFQGLVRRVPVSRHVVSYAVAIARATRPRSEAASEYAKRYVEWGAGPRASQYLVLAGKALAVLDGKPAVTSAHIRQAAPWVLRHRVLPNYTASGEGITSEQIVKKIVADISEPRYA
jgi:MoxR-like ATPase